MADYAHGDCLKLDWADLYPGEALQKRSGFIRCYCFTPDDPDASVDAVSGPIPTLTPERAAKWRSRSAWGGAEAPCEPGKLHLT